jgi:hypothetical protein
MIYGGKMNSISTNSNAAIEFHDSEVGSLCSEGASLSISFAPASIHRSDGAPGRDPGTCWTQGVNLVLLGAHISGVPPQLPCPLFGGTVTLGDQTYDNVLPAPLAYTGDVVVDLVFEDGSAIRATADGLRLELVGDPVFVEEYPG